MVPRSFEYAHPRTALGWLPVAVLTACLLTGCDDESGDAKSSTAAATAAAQSKAAAAAMEKVRKQCDQLGQTCGQKDKHKKKIAEECRAEAKQPAEKGCADRAVAMYECYEKKICTKDERIWALDDFRVLTERTKNCVDERVALQKCLAGAMAAGS